MIWFCYATVFLAMLGAVWYAEQPLQIEPAWWRWPELDVRR